MTPRREYYDLLGSTQERAGALARTGAPPGTRVVAARQTAGHGRAGRTWESPPGGLYLSVVVGPPPRFAELLALGVGTLLAERLGATYALPIRVKWPNDLVVARTPGRRRKLAGVLVDAVVDAFGQPVEIVGVGVNVRPSREPLSASVRDRAAFLEELIGRPVDLGTLEEEVVGAMTEAHDALEAPDGAEAVRARCRRLLYGVGSSVTVDGQSAGRLVGVAADGALLVGDGYSEVPIRAGDVELLEDPA